MVVDLATLPPKNNDIHIKTNIIYGVKCVFNIFTLNSINDFNKIYLVNILFLNNYHVLINFY